MNTKLALALASSAATAALILSCSDDSPGDADAAVCDCPAAEPPLAGRLTTVEDRRENPGAVPGFSAVARCPDGATLLGGGCEASANASSVLLSNAGRRPSGPAFGCSWLNPQNDSPDYILAWATCLMPAP
ncbi:MAG: hypothetical protein KJZ92_17535 [Rhodocyclaceae bacterium]|nr:hypothetical protein [Rhodocyclaceae bacterium]